MGCQSFRFGTGTELSHLMRHRMEFWLKMGSLLLLSQRIISVYQVVYSHGTPADLRWITVNSKSNSGACICGTMEWEDGLGRLKRNSMKFSLPFMLLWNHQVDSFVCLASPSFFFSAFLLLSFLPNSFFPLFRMIMSPKNVFLQVFNTLVFEAQSKWLLLSVLCCSKC